MWSPRTRGISGETGSVFFFARGPSFFHTTLSEDMFLKLYISPKRVLIGAIAIGLLALPVTGAHAAGGSDTLTITAGTLTINGAAPGNFAATLTGADQQVYTTLGTFTSADLTGTGTGWNLTFQATKFACTNGTDTGCPAGNDTLPASSLLVAPPTVACHAGTSCAGRAAVPTVSIVANTALDGGAAVKLASAAANKGMGTYDFTPGNTSGANTNLQLTVPSYAYATTYHSTLTVSIVSGP